MPGRPTTLAYGWAGACCACSRCGTGVFFFFFCFFFFVVVVVSSRLSYLHFLMPHLLGDGWTYCNIVVSVVIIQRLLSVATRGVLAKYWLTA